MENGVHSMVAVGASPTTQTNSRIRLALLLGFGLATLLVIATLVKYPGTGQSQAQYLILGIVQIVFLIVASAVIALLVTRNRSVGGNRVMRTSIFVGVLLGLLWVVEIK